MTFQSQMDDTKIGSIVPLSLQRRINRIIKIEEIFSDEISSTVDENGQFDAIVC